MSSNVKQQMKPFELAFHPITTDTDMSDHGDGNQGYDETKAIKDLIAHAND